MTKVRLFLARPISDNTGKFVEYMYKSVVVEVSSIIELYPTVVGVEILDGEAL